MITIGMNYGFHESAIAISLDGKIVFAAAEERFTRIKQDRSFPVNAIRAGFAELGISANDIDVVSLSWPLGFDMVLHDAKMLLKREYLPSLSRFKKVVSGLIAARRSKKKFEDMYCSNFPRPRSGFYFANHHLTHALSAFSLGETSESVCVVFDGRGATEATTFWTLNDGVPEKLFERSYPQSLGVMYANVTKLLGFEPFSDEWKVMGLASYGDPSVDLSECVIKHSENEKSFNGTLFLARNDNDLSLFEQKFSYYSRFGEEELEKKHMDMAASAQQASEEIMLQYVTNAIRMASLKDVCLAGGVALNCKANGEILRRSEANSVTIQPASGDDGTSIGAALMGGIDRGVPMQIQPKQSSYLGTSYSDEEIELALVRAKVRFRCPENLVDEVASALADDKLVGWFQGRMEFGPRALGNRSILSSPTKAENRDKVNEAVKFRELWRPFAPAVMDEHGDKYFDDYVTSPYMILSFWANQFAKETIPAVVHEDGSCRVQSVSRLSNPLFYNLLSAFSDKSEVHVLMNTSFNLKGEPIVESPIDALRTFYSSGLDLLAIGSFIVYK